MHTIRRADVQGVGYSIAVLISLANFRGHIKKFRCKSFVNPTSDAKLVQSIRFLEKKEENYYNST